MTKREKMLKAAGMILVALAVVAMPGVSKASILGTVDIAHDGFGADGVCKVWGGGQDGTSVHAGVYMLDKSGDTGQGDIWDDGLIGAFCIELSQSSSDNTKTYDVVYPKDAQCPTTFLGGKIGDVKAAYLSELWGRYYDSAWADGGPYSSQEKSDAEAFAAAVWEIVYEDVPSSTSLYDVTADSTPGSRGFRATGIDSTTANSWLRSLDGTGPKAELRAFTNCCKQDYITEMPEPATLLMLAFGGIALIRKRLT